MSARKTLYQWLNEPSLDDKASVLLTVLLSMAIVVNIAEVVFSTTDEFALWFSPYDVIVLHIFLAVIFALEYIARIWCEAEAPDEQGLSAWQKRWRYIRSGMGIIDLVSFLPIVWFLLFPSQEFNDLRVLKLISMIRVLKLTRYSASLLMLARVYQENKNTLLAAMMVLMILIFVASTGIYIFENSTQPDVFGSIPQCMWWAFVTLTTVGYGDVVPITVGGKIFGAMVMICGVGVAAMPAGIFASSFVQLLREQEHEQRRKRRMARLEKMSAMSKGEPLHVELSLSEQREVAYLVSEYGLTLEQATGIVIHFRH